MNKSVKILLSLTLTASVLLAASCSPSSGEKRSGRNRDRDDDDDGPGFTRTTTAPSEETEPSESTVSYSGPAAPYDFTVDPEAGAAYASVLAQNEDAILAFESEFHSWECPAINLIDLTGDSVPELVFKYEGYDYVNMSVYEYDAASGEAVLRLDIPVESYMGSWGLGCDVVFLEDGSMLVSNMMGSGGNYEQEMQVYECVPSAAGLYTLIYDWVIEEEMPDGSADCVPVSATLDGADLSTDDFYLAQETYVASIAAPVMPYTSRVCYDDYTVTDIFGRDWCGIPGSVFAEGQYYFYHDFESCYGGTTPSTVLYEGATAEEAYLQILDEYENNMRMIEISRGGTAIESCSYADITGDGQEELFIWYNADSENNYVSPDPDDYMYASMRVFTYDADRGRAVEMLYLKNAVTFASSGFFADVALLDNGDLIFHVQGGSLEYYYDEYSTYEVQDSTLACVDVYRKDDILISFDPEETYEYVYSHNEVAAGEEEFADMVDYYIDSMTLAIAAAPWYDNDSGSGSAWEQRLMSVPSTSLYFDDMMDMLTQ